MPHRSIAPLLLVIAAGCSRSVPAAPAGSALSATGAEAPVAVVGLAIREEPPLPGEPAGDWAGLGPAPAAPAHAHHHHRAPSPPAEPPAPEPGSSDDHGDHHAH